MATGMKICDILKFLAKDEVNLVIITDRDKVEQFDRGYYLSYPSFLAYNSYTLTETGWIAVYH